MARAKQPATFVEPTGLPPQVTRVAALLSRLPGVGFKASAKHAQWFATQPFSIATELAEALIKMTEVVRICVQCGNLTEQVKPQVDDEETIMVPLCSICTDPKRDPSIVCVVATIGNLLSFEKAGTWKGLYFVLGKLLSPLDGISADELPIDLLVNLLTPGMEVVLAFPDSVDGNATGLCLARELMGTGVKVTQLSAGVSYGADLDFADAVTLGNALKRRVEVKPS